MPSPTHKAQRQAIIERLDEEQEHDLANKLRRCASQVRLTCVCCGAERFVEQGCGQRWCPCCNIKITTKRLALFTHAAQLLKWPLAVTLTQENTLSAENCLRDFKAGLKRFRRQKLFKSTVRSGIVSFEVTNTGSGWHPHAHLLLDSRWLALRTRAPRSSDSKATVRQLCKEAHEELSREWASHLGQEHGVVWVERAFGKALLETVKYAVKPCDLLECSEAIGPLIREMKGLRMVYGFGALYGMSKKFKAMEKEARQPTKCDECQEETEFLPDCAVLRRVKSPPGRRSAVALNTPPRMTRTRR